MGALQGIGTPTPYATPPVPWGNPWSGATQVGYPLAQPFSGFAGMPMNGVFGSFTQPQTLQSFPPAVQHVAQQLQQIQQLVLSVPLQLQQIQHLVQLVPQQLQQIQQLIQLLAQQSYHLQHAQGLPPFQIPSLGTPGWHTGQQHLFGGQPGYVM